MIKTNKDLNLRLKFLLIIGLICIASGVYNLWVEDDLFAIGNFLVGGVSLYVYHKMKAITTERPSKTWRSYERR